MINQIVFIAVLLLTIGVFIWTIRRLFAYAKLTQESYRIDQIGKRINMTLAVAMGQTKIFRMPLIGLAHALVFWGFLVILVGSIEMILDGILGTERIFGFAGIVYDIVFGTGDVFAYIVFLGIMIFLFRRLFMKINRFYGIEMLKKSKLDANIALTLIALLMLSLIGMNVFYIAMHQGHAYEGVYPISAMIAPMFSGLEDIQLQFLHDLNWWLHILLVFAFINILPYSKHFHVFMSIPNVFISKLKPLTYMPVMENVYNEVKMMMDPNMAFAEPPADAPPPSRFGLKDAEDAPWTSYIASLSCTECGRCTAVCPANITGKKLSPRKIMIDLRARMKEKGAGLVKDKKFDDQKSLIGDYISHEELWACTSCNACAQECPINIDQPSLILEMRRYLVMEESNAPTEINNMFRNIENNGAPWQYPPEDRMLWTEGIVMNEVGSD